MKKKHEVTLTRIGGEVVVGSITKEQFDFWVNQDEDVFSQHVIEDDQNDPAIPPGAWIGSQWFELNDVAHVSGCELSKYNHMDVCLEGEGRRCVFESSLGVQELGKAGVRLKFNKISQHILEHGYYFLLHPLEKGGLTVEIEMEGDFSPNKLTLLGTEFDFMGKENQRIFISSIEYEGGEVFEGDGFGDGVFTGDHWIKFFKV